MHESHGAQAEAQAEVLSSSQGAAEVGGAAPVQAQLPPKLGTKPAASVQMFWQAKVGAGKRGEAYAS
jgi:hypothetical protein